MPPHFSDTCDNCDCTINAKRKNGIRILHKRFWNTAKGSCSKDIGKQQKDPAVKISENSRRILQQEPGRTAEYL